MGSSLRVFLSGRLLKWSSQWGTFVWAARGIPSVGR